MTGSKLITDNYMDKLKNFAREKINASLDAYEKEQGAPIDWGNDEEVLYVFSQLNTDEGSQMAVAFDTVSGVTQQGGQDTVMATCYSQTLGHSLILSWEVRTNFKDRDEFLTEIESLFQDAEAATLKINRLLK